MAIDAPERASECAYHLLPTGIHVITFNSATPDAVAELFVHLNAIFDGRTHNNPRLLILMDGSSTGIPSLNRLMIGAKDLVARHPDRPKVRYAFVFQGSMRYIMSALERFIQLFRATNEVRSFLPSERAQAEAWLLRDALKEE